MAKIVTVLVVKHKKHELLPFYKTRPNLSTLKYIKPSLSCLNNKTVCAQSKNGHGVNLHWFKERTWIEYAECIGKIHCWVCHYYFDKILFKSDIVEKKQDTFASAGYNDWIHALQSLFNHENLDTHILCMELHVLSISKQQSIQDLISNKVKKGVQ